MRELPDILRDSDWNVTITVWGNKRIISFELGDTTRMLYGYAVDIGTSKVVGHLVNLARAENSLMI